LTHLGKQSNLLGKDKDGVDLDLTKLVDGAVPAALLNDIKALYREVQSVDSWSLWYRFLGLEDLASMCTWEMADMLVRCLQLRSTFLLNNRTTCVSFMFGINDASRSPQRQLTPAQIKHMNDSFELDGYSNDGRGGVQRSRSAGSGCAAHASPAFTRAHSSGSGEIEPGKIVVKGIPLGCTQAMLRESFGRSALDQTVFLCVFCGDVPSLVCTETRLQVRSHYVDECSRLQGKQAAYWLHPVC
jgi:hypothetical protein